MDQKLQDQSSYPGYFNRRGTVVRSFDIDVHGNSADNDDALTVKLSDAIGGHPTDLEGMLVTGARIVVTTGLNNTAGVKLEVAGTSVITTALGTAGTYDGGVTAAAPIGIAAANAEVVLTYPTSGAALTTGLFLIILDVIQAE